MNVMSVIRYCVAVDGCAGAIGISLPLRRSELDYDSSGIVGCAQVVNVPDSIQGVNKQFCINAITLGREPKSLNIIVFAYT